MQLSIIEQHNQVDIPVICPHCRNEIGQYDDAKDYLKNDLCPFCNCEEGHDDEGTKEWCTDCERRCDGQKYVRRRNAYVDRVDYETKLRKEEWV